MFTYLVAIPIGIYSATHQYSLTDYSLTTLGFIGLATPNFLLGLILLYVFYKFFGPQHRRLLFARHGGAGVEHGQAVLDLISHLWIPVIVIGTATTAGTIRVMRGTLLDELGKQYVITARAKGVAEPRVIFKYPVRLALNPMVSGVGGVLPELISGETIVAIVIGLPTLGPLMYTAVRAQDINLSGQRADGDQRAGGDRRADFGHPAGGRGPAHQLRTQGLTWRPIPLP